MICGRSGTRLQTICRSSAEGLRPHHVARVYTRLKQDQNGLVVRVWCCSTGHLTHYCNCGCQSSIPGPIDTCYGGKSDYIEEGRWEIRYLSRVQGDTCHARTKPTEYFRPCSSPQSCTSPFQLRAQRRASNRRITPTGVRSTLVTVKKFSRYRTGNFDPYRIYGTV
jgi:hypothetical protein